MQRRKIAVLRASGLGDFIFSLPALQALGNKFPDDEIVYLGRQVHRNLLQGRPGPVDRVIVVPPFPGVGSEEDYIPDRQETETFFEVMRSERFDVAIQMHGGGRNSNPFLLKLGAAYNIGFATADATPLDITIPYFTYFSETLRCLEAVSMLGAYTTQLDPKLEVTGADRIEILKRYPDIIHERIAVINPGAMDRRRRWPLENFAQIANYLVEQGMHVYINASGPVESELAEAIRTLANFPSEIVCCHDLSITGLVGLLSMAELMVSNDSGPLHLAYALQVPSVGIFLACNMITATPMTTRLVRPLISWNMKCPLCGTKVQDIHAVTHCLHDVSLVRDISVDEVRIAIRELMEQNVSLNAAKAVADVAR